MTPQAWFAFSLAIFLAGAVGLLAALLSNARAEINRRINALADLRLKVYEFHEATKMVQGSDLFASMRNNKYDRYEWTRKLARAIVKLTSDYRQ